MSGVLEQQQGVGAAEEQRKEVSGGRRGGHQGLAAVASGHRVSIIAVLTLGPGCYHPHLKLERLRFWADETEQGIRHRGAQGHTTLGLALWLWPSSCLSSEDNAGGAGGGSGVKGYGKWPDR